MSARTVWPPNDPALLGTLLRRHPTRRAEIDPFAAIALLLTPCSSPSSPQQLLLIQRAEREGDPWSGHMALPGGRIDPADADPLSAALRELAEETGIQLTSTHLLSDLDDVRARGGPTPGAPVPGVRPFVFWLDRVPSLSLSDEVADAMWVPLGELLDSACDCDVNVRETVLRVPAYRWRERTVWGMTHRVICSFFERLG